jgi:hypothetical protein
LGLAASVGMPPPERTFLTILIIADAQKMFNANTTKKTKLTNTTKV